MNFLNVNYAYHLKTKKGIKNEAHFLSTATTLLLYDHLASPLINRNILKPAYIFTDVQACAVEHIDIYNVKF